MEPMENQQQKKSIFFKLSLQHLIDKDQATYFYAGLLMLILYGFCDVFSNIYSSWLIGVTSPFFIICSFLFLLFRFTQYKKILILKVPTKEEKENQREKQDIESKAGVGEESGETFKGNTSQVITFQNSQVDKLFKPIKYLAILYLVTNFVSCTLFFVSPLVKKKPAFTVSSSDFGRAQLLVGNPDYSKKSIIDSVNVNFPQQLFYSPGTVEAFVVDTTGNYDYHVQVINHHTNKKLNFKFNKNNSFISNQTDCNLSFCRCSEGNVCFKLKKVDFFQFLLMQQGIVKDTIYMVRIRN